MLENFNFIHKYSETSNSSNDNILGNLAPSSDVIAFTGGINEIREKLLQN